MQIKYVFCKFSRALSWEELKKVDFGADVIYVAQSDIPGVLGFRCQEASFEVISRKLKKQKVAFVLEK